MSNSYPPQGGNPYADQPLPGGQSPAFQNLPQGGFPPAAPPRRGRRLGKKILIAVLVAVVGLVIAVLKGVGGEAETAAVGDCVKNTGTDSSAELKIVPCTDPSAAGKILKKVKGGTDGESSCSAVVGATSYYLQKEPTQTFVLCLGPPK
ncbi:LppU/SCO3897 family protein [Streptomyces virginiae]|uniref:LppU/SCO3897 family protein n=1 Tax=Streptomyces virginiae TaxID=1961 RepID=UPI000ABDB963